MLHSSLAHWINGPQPWTVCPEEKTEDLKNEKEELKDSNTNLKLISEGTTSKDNLKNYIREKEKLSKAL